MELFKKLNQTGIAHLAALVVIVVALAAVGTYLLVASHAAVLYAGCNELGSVKIVVTDPNTGAVKYNYTEPYHQTLGQGNAGTCVKTLQTQLNKWCTPSTQLATDGIFGAKTALALKNWQYSFTPKGQYNVWKVNGNLVSVDGVAGPQTWGILHVYDGNYPYGTSPTRGGLICSYPR